MFRSNASFPLGDPELPLVICDLGGVLVSLRARKQIPGFEAYIETVERAERASGREDLRFDLQSGRLALDDYLACLRAVDPQYSASQVRELENGLLAGLMAERIAFLHGLRSALTARWVVLSNTHCLHWDRISADPALAALFDAAYLSYEIGALKPDVKAFHHVLRLEQIDAGRCFFLDDLSVNLEAARSLGIQGVQVDDTEAWRDTLALWLARASSSREAS